MVAAVHAGTHIQSAGWCLIISVISCDLAAVLHIILYDAAVEIHFVSCTSDYGVISSTVDAALMMYLESNGKGIGRKSQSEEALVRTELGDVRDKIRVWVSDRFYMQFILILI